VDRSLYDFGRAAAEDPIQGGEFLDKLGDWRKIAVVTYMCIIFRNITWKEETVLKTKTNVGR
jgi:hypothetical protein